MKKRVMQMLDAAVSDQAAGARVWQITESGISLHCIASALL